MKGAAFFEKIEKIKMPIRIVILVGTVVVIAGAFFYFIYFPKKEEMKKTSDSITQLEQQLRIAKLRSKDLEKLKAEKEEVSLQLSEALKLLPNTKEIPSLLRKVTELGNDSDLDFRIFKPQRERPKEFYVEIPVSIEVRGAYHNVAVFFEKVGKMERIMNIHNVTMRPIAERSTTLITTCDAVTYRFKGEIDDTTAPKKNN